MWVILVIWSVKGICLDREQSQLLLQTCATYFEEPYDKSTMDQIIKWDKAGIENDNFGKNISTLWKQYHEKIIFSDIESDKTWHNSIYAQHPETNTEKEYSY